MGNENNSCPSGYWGFRTFQEGNRKLRCQIPGGNIRVTELQKTVLLGTARIVKKTLKNTQDIFFSESFLVILSSVLLIRFLVGLM